MIKKRFLSILALLCLTVSSAWAQGPWTSGDCTLTLSNGTMTVSGNGAMADYDSEEDRPWHDYSSNITSLVVESGVTTIGSRAFYSCTALTSVTLPEGLTTINVRTFYKCNSLTTLTIPSTVTSINSNDEFYDCTSMTDVYLYADPANLTWPEDGDDFKDNMATKCHVLAEHLAAYQSNFSDVNVTFVGDLQPQAAATENVTNIIFNDLGLDNAWDLTSNPLTVGNIELNFDKADGSNPPAFYTSGGGTARIYKGNTMSISAGGATITKIVFTYASDVTPAFSTGSYTSSTKTWEGEATTLTVTNAYTTNTQIRIKSMDVYYSVASAAGEATYTVTLKEGTEDADKWTITPAEATTTGVAQGTEITATYNGTKLVKSVKATKKVAPAAAEGHPLSASEVGEIVCSDGLAYAAADKDNLPTGVTAVAIVAYLGDGDTSDDTYNHGLAIAMSDANDGSSCEWASWGEYNCVSKSNDIATAIGYKDGISSTNTLTSDGHTHEAATAAVSNNGTAAPTGTSGWFLPSIGQWNLIVQGLATKKAGSDVTTDITTSENNTYKASNLNSVITDAGGTGFNGDYHSSTQYDSDWCWHMNISSGCASGYPFNAGDYVRSVLAF